MDEGFVGTIISGYLFNLSEQFKIEDHHWPFVILVSSSWHSSPIL